MDISVKLSRGSIVLRAKDDTYLSARTFLSTHESNAVSKYEMQADERATHERKLLASIPSALSELKLVLPKYRVKDTLDGNNDEFDVTFEVSERFDSGKVEDVKRLTEEYIYKKITSEWWKSNYPDASASYVLACSEAADNLQRCFVLQDPDDSTNGLKYKCYSQKCFYTILLYKEALMNEIHMEMLKFSRMNTNQKGLPNINFQTDEVYDEGLLIKLVDKHIGRINSRVSAYLYKSDGELKDESNNGVPAYGFNLIMPIFWDKRLFEELAEEMCSYVVNSVLYEWLKTVMPEKSAIYMNEADQSYNNIKHIVTIRKRGVLRKPIQPF